MPDERANGGSQVQDGQVLDRVQKLAPHDVNFQSSFKYMCFTKNGESPGLWTRILSYPDVFSLYTSKKRGRQLRYRSSEPKINTAFDIP